MAEPSKERIAVAQKRVDAASDEAVALAMDAVFDKAIQIALVVRLNRPADMCTVTRSETDKPSHPFKLSLVRTGVGRSA